MKEISGESFSLLAKQCYVITTNYSATQSRIIAKHSCVQDNMLINISVNLICFRFAEKPEASNFPVEKIVYNEQLMCDISLEERYNRVSV